MCLCLPLVGMVDIENESTSPMEISIVLRQNVKGLDLRA